MNKAELGHFSAVSLGLFFKSKQELDRRWRRNFPPLVAAEKPGNKKITEDNIPDVYLSDKKRMTALRAHFLKKNRGEQN